MKPPIVCAFSPEVYPTSKFFHLSHHCSVFNCINNMVKWLSNERSKKAQDELLALMESYVSSEDAQLASQVFRKATAAETDKYFNVDKSNYLDMQKFLNCKIPVCNDCIKVVGDLKLSDFVEKSALKACRSLADLGQLAKSSEGSGPVTLCDVDHTNLPIFNKMKDAELPYKTKGPASIGSHVVQIGGTFWAVAHSDSKYFERYQYKPLACDTWFRKFAIVFQKKNGKPYGVESRREWIRLVSGLKEDQFFSLLANPKWRQTVIVVEMVAGQAYCLDSMNPHTFWTWTNPSVNPLGLVITFGCKVFSTGRVLQYVKEKLSTTGGKH